MHNKVYQKWRRNLIFIIISFILLLIASWKLAFQKSFVLKSEITENTIKVNEIGDIKGDIINLRHLLDQQRDGLTGLWSLSIDKLTRTLLESTLDIADSLNIIVIDFKEPVFRDEDKIKIVYHTVHLQGNFNSLLQYLYILEQKQSACNVLSAHFEVVINKKTKQRELKLKAYLQNAIIQ
ncbi:MAG: hypothetical protein ACEPOV_14305 [Hyphomicrobiales bacterium]